MFDIFGSHYHSYNHERLSCSRACFYRRLSHRSLSPVQLVLSCPCSYWCYMNKIHAPQPHTSMAFCMHSTIVCTSVVCSPADLRRQCMVVHLANSRPCTEVLGPSADLFPTGHSPMPRFPVATSLSCRTPPAELHVFRKIHLPLPPTYPPTKSPPLNDEPCYPRVPMVTWY